MEFSLDQIKSFLDSSNTATRFAAKQLLFHKLPVSFFVENYLYDNENRQQSLELFPMFRSLYDNIPDRLILKCSRKTLKSSCLSNILCINMIRNNNYRQLYCGNLDSTAKAFSNNYFVPRFNSPKIKQLVPKGFIKEDVYEKILEATNSSILFRFFSEDASRIRGPSTFENAYDETQEMALEQIDIANETMSILPTKRERYAGTPLSTSNTLHILWKRSNQSEWMTKCGCGHWNWLGEGNDPLSMLQEKGYCCSKCSRILNTLNGEWVAFNPSEKEFIGFHLAQPMLPYFAQDERQWKKIYHKVQTLNEMTLFNEVLGLAYNAASTRPITLEELQGACVLGPMYHSEDKNRLIILENNKRSYFSHHNGTDWGVNMKTSRTVTVQGAMTPNGVFHIYYMKQFKNYEYQQHIQEIASMATSVNAKCACDSGPDAARGVLLAEMVGGPTKCNLVRYEHGKLIQHYDWIPGTPWQTGRWCLHRSDVLGWCLRMIKQKKILFPRWEDVSGYMQDILNVFTEIHEGTCRQEIFYRHLPDEPDDFLHAITFAAASAFCEVGGSELTGASSSASSGTIIY